MDLVEVRSEVTMVSDFSLLWIDFILLLIIPQFGIASVILNFLLLLKCFFAILLDTLMADSLFESWIRCFEEPFPLEFGESLLAFSNWTRDWTSDFGLSKVTLKALFLTISEVDILSVDLIDSMDLFSFCWSDNCCCGSLVLFCCKFISFECLFRKREATLSVSLENCCRRTVAKSIGARTVFLDFGDWNRGGGFRLRSFVVVVGKLIGSLIGGWNSLSVKVSFGGGCCWGFSERKLCTLELGYWGLIIALGKHHLLANFTLCPNHRWIEAL